jgi:hypothetical protein
MRKLIPLMVIGGVLMGAGAYWWYTRPYDAAKLMQCLPEERSLHVYLDVNLLRSSGILDVLAGSKSLEDADYKQFIEETGFDYRTDLDAVAAAFHDGDEAFAVRGRFHWDKISKYFLAHGGKCEQIECSMPASQPGRLISYYPIRTDVLALAVSRDPHAAYIVGPGAWKMPPQIPLAAVWVSAPPYVFSDPNAFPTGSRSFLSPLAQALGTTFTLGPSADKKSFELRMEVTAATAEDAAKLATQLTDVTDLLKKMLNRDKMKPNAADLSGVLVAGRFEAQQNRVTGSWPIERSFLDSLVSGKVE